MAFLVPYVQQQGYVSIAEIEKGETATMDFGLLSLEAGGEFEGTTEGTETGLLILAGRCTVKGDGFEFADIGGRENVFGGKPYAVYLPPHASYSVMTPSYVEIAICSTPSDSKRSPRLISPGDVMYKSLGRLHWRRDVHYIIEPRTNSDTLRIGEVIYPPGHWNLPPHCHDAVEEIYFYRVRTEDGFGLQMVYTEDRTIDEHYIVKNNDTIVIPKGYHPAAASPGDSLYILWTMAPPKESLPLISQPDPRYAWADDCGAMVRELMMK
jgi:5-deoxy-glucuronate isomerase